MKETHAAPRGWAKSGLVAAVLLLSFHLIVPSPSHAQTQNPILLGMGDSIGEGVQSADASVRTQPATYLNWVARKLGVQFTLPLIQSGPFGMVGDTDRRSRIFPFLPAANIAVSGATVNSLLNDRADAMTVEEIDSETDLVNFPRLGSQIEIAEALRPPSIICWIGNNDVLGAATSFDQLDGSQVTSVPAFTDRFNQIADRLGALDSKVAFANIPDITSIGFLLDREDLVRFVGSDFGLAEGDFTTIVTMLLIRLGLDDGSLLQDPNFVLDASEVVFVQERIEIFNRVIDEGAARIGAPVLDINSIFNAIAANPPVILGVPVTPRFLGGIFSLDGVHPSNITHAIVADQFIELINAHFQTNIPRLTPSEFLQTFLADPFVDKDGDGRVRGRPLAGLLETLGPILGISGDRNDFVADDFSTQIDTNRGQRFMNQYRALQGKGPLRPHEWGLEDTIKVFRDIFSTLGVPQRDIGLR